MYLAPSTALETQKNTFYNKFRFYSRLEVVSQKKELHNILKEKTCLDYFLLIKIVEEKRCNVLIQNYAEPMLNFIE